MVQGAAPGQTKVIADYGGQKAEGVLNVVPAGEMAVTGVGVGTDNIYDDHGGGRVLIDGGGSRIIPAGKVVGLVFSRIHTSRAFRPCRKPPLPSPV